MTRWLTIGLAVLALAACGDDDDTTLPPTHSTVVTTAASDERPEQVPATAIAVDTPKGRVWIDHGDTVYGPCTVVEPYKDRLDELVGQAPRDGVAGFGFVCY